MKPFKFSLSGMMAAVALFGLGIAVFRIPWPLLRVSGLFTLVVLLLLTATLGAVLNRRASWIGFSLFGWTWLVYAFLALEIGPKQSSAEKIPLPMPITSLWLMELSAHVLKTHHLADGNAATMILNSEGGHSLVSHATVQVHLLVDSLLAACLGAFMGWWLKRAGARSVFDVAARSERSPAGEVRS